MTDLPPGIVPKPKKTAPALPPGIIPKSSYAGAPKVAPVSPVVEKPKVAPAPVTAATRPFRAPLPQPASPDEAKSTFQTRIADPWNRGMANLQSSLGAAASGVQLEKLRAMDAIDRMLTRGRPGPSGFRSEAVEAEPDKVLPRTGEQDPFTYATALGDLDVLDYARSTTPQERAAVRKRVEDVLGSQVEEVVQGSVKAASIPKNPAVARAQNAKSFGEFWDAFKEAPGTFITDTVIESAPNMIPTFVGGAVGGPVGGRIGFAAGAGAGSGVVELGSSIAQKLQELGADMQDPESIQQVLKDHEAEIFEYARTRAVAVGLFDALGARIAAGKLVPGRPVAEAVGQTVAGAGSGMGGEIIATAGTGQDQNVGAVLSEGIGEVAGQAGEVATAGAEGLRTQQPPVNRRDLERFLAEPPQNVAQPTPQPAAPSQPETAEPASATIKGDGTKASPRVVETPEDLLEATSQAASSPLNAAPEPTPAQKEAGNYKKAHIKVQGINIAIETPKGGVRRGTGPEGDWEVVMPVAYGYDKDATGADGDKLDISVGESPEAAEVYVIDQLDPATGDFDEHKVFAAEPDMVTAIQHYDESFSGGGFNRIGAVTPMSIDEYNAWKKSRKAKKPVGNIAEAQSAIRARLAEQQALAAQPEAAPAVPNQTQPAPSPEPVTVQPMPGRPLPKGIVPKASRGRKQAWVSITGLARKMGGIKDVGGDLRAMDMLRLRPGVINNRSGIDLDRFAEALFQMPEWRDQIASEDDPDTWDVKKVAALMAEELSGRAPTPRGEESAAEDAQGAREEEAFREKSWQAANARTQELLGRDLDPKEFEAILARHVSEGYERIEDAVTDQLESDVIADEQAKESKYYGQENVQARPEEAPARDRDERADERGPEGAPGRPPEDEARERGPEADQGSPRARGPQTELTDQGEQAVMPGMERSAKQAMQARDEKRGGRMGTDKAQQEPGGMFDLPDDRQTDIERAAPATPEEFLERVFPKKKAKAKPSEIDRMENYFRPNRVVPAYGGTFDRVISFYRVPAKDGSPGWMVRVREVDSKGNFLGPIRSHRTMPAKKDLEAWERDNPVLEGGAELGNTRRPGLDMTRNAAQAITGTPRQANTQAAEWTVKLGKQTGREYAVALSADGKVISAAVGTQDNVTFVEVAQRAFADPASSIIIHHNHPIAAALSNTDLVNLASPGIGFVVAHNHDGTFSAARVSAAAWPDLMVTVEGAKLAIDQAYNKAWEQLQIIVDPVERQNAVMHVLAGIGLLDYHTSIKPRTGFASLIRQAAETLRKELADAGWRYAQDTSGGLRRPTTYDHAAPAMAAISVINARDATGRRTVPSLDGMGSGSGRLENRGREGAGAGPILGPRAAHESGRGPSSQVETDAFKRWFGDSKVVDKDGNPLVVYHGTTENIQFFDAGKRGANTGAPSADEGFFFTSRPKTADYYATVNDRAMKQEGDFKVKRALEKAHRVNPLQTSQESAARIRGEINDMSGPNVMPVYLSLQNPLIHDFKGRVYRDESYRKLIDRAKAEGHDGLILRRTFDAGEYGRVDALLRGRFRSEDIYVAFRPEQIKSAIGNRGTFDPRSAVILENRTFGNPNAPNVATRAAGQQVQLDILKHLNRPGWRAGAERRLRSWRQVWRDRFATMADVEKYIEGKTGQKTPAAKSFYKQEEVFTGKVADQLQQFHEGMLKELYDAMHDTGLSVKEIEKYLVAKHAPERNATIAAINPKLPDGGSGMTNAQAQAVIDRFRQQGKLGVLQRVSDAVKRIRRFDLDTRIRAGLIPARDVADKLRDWPNYVPLKGFEELFTDDELVSRPRPRLGSGFSVKNREYFSAMGRESEATNILANLISQAEESIVRAEKIKVAQVLADFVTANPDDSFWKVDLVTTKRVIDPDTGLVKVEYTRMPSLEDEEQFVIYFKKDGQLHRIWIANPRLVANIRNMSANELPKWTNALRLFATIFRAVNVNANPEFVIPNAVRDLQTGLVQALQHKAPGLKRKMVKYWPQAAKASWAGYGGKGGPAGTWLGWYRRMARAGGKVDFFNIDDIESQASNIEGEMRRRTKKPLAIGENVLRGAYKLIDRANHSVENAVRLAAFRAMVEAGFTDAEAASVSKNITVNFNRRGEVSRWANLLWPFFNAAVQGTFTLGTAAARSGKVRGALAGLTMLGFAEGIVNGLLSAGGDDDEDESDFDKIPDYIRRKNIIIMNPGYPKNGGPPYWQLPIGYGLNVFWNAGREMSDIALGKKTIGEALGNVGISAADAFIPIDIDSLTGLLPSFAQAPGEVLANQDYSGKPIYREPTDSEKKANLPDSSITRPGTNEVWKAVAEGLNKMSGGSNYEPGLFDFHPESLEHIFKTYAGGVGNIISRTADLLSPEPGDSFELGKVPVIRKVIGYFPRSTESNRYYENRGEIDEAVGRLKAAEEAGDEAAAERFAEKGERQLGLEGELKASEKRLRQLRKEAREVRAEPGMPAEERKAALQAIYEEMDAETAGFNKTFYQEIERPRQMERSPTIRPLFEKKRKDVRATLEGEF